MIQREIARAVEPGKEAVANPANSAETTQARQREVRRRIPMSIPKAKLSVPEISGYHLHWINDYPGRIDQALQSGYEFVTPEEAMLSNFSLGASQSVSGNTDLGSRVSIVVGRGDDATALRAYLMKIREDWYAEDQAISQQRVDNISQQIKKGIIGADQESGLDKSKRYVRQADFSLER